MDFRQKKKSCGATSLPFFTTWQKRKVGSHGILAEKETVWRDLKNQPNLFYFFVYQYRLNAPMGDVNSK